MTHKPRLRAVRDFVSEALFTVSDWLFDAGRAIQPVRHITAQEAFNESLVREWEARHARLSLNDTPEQAEQRRAHMEAIRSPVRVWTRESKDT